MFKKNRISVVLFAAALALVLYPLFASVYNSFVQRTLVAEYEENISEIDVTQTQEMLELAQGRNAELASGTDSGLFSAELSDAEIYESLLDPDGDGMMGSIEIPSVGVYLPVYHYSSEEVLAKGIGHIETSALPVGGTGTRCVLTGHRGLPGSRLFTDLDQLEEGDLFYLHVLNETFAYEVTEIEIVEPDETDALAADPEEDLCTLVTCTPYGVNSHRLLVTGTRTEYVPSEEESRTVFLDRWEYLLLLAAAGETILFFLQRRGQNRPAHSGVSRKGGNVS